MAVCPPGQLVRRASADRLGGSTSGTSKARSAALCQLARMFGIQFTVAVAWQRASAGDRAGYAAGISRRSPAASAPLKRGHDTRQRS